MLYSDKVKTVLQNYCTLHKLTPRDDDKLSIFITNTKKRKFISIVPEIVEPEPEPEAMPEQDEQLAPEQTSEVQSEQNEQPDPEQFQEVQPNLVQTPTIQSKPIQAETDNSNQAQTPTIQPKPINTPENQPLPVQTPIIQPNPINTPENQSLPVQTPTIQPKPIQTETDNSNQAQASTIQPNPIQTAQHVIPQQFPPISDSISSILGRDPNTASELFIRKCDSMSEEEVIDELSKYIEETLRLNQSATVDRHPRCVFTFAIFTNKLAKERPNFENLIYDMIIDYIEYYTQIEEIDEIIVTYTQYIVSFLLNFLFIDRQRAIQKGFPYLRKTITNDFLSLLIGIIFIYDCSPLAQPVDNASYNEIISKLRQININNQIPAHKRKYNQLVTALNFSRYTSNHGDKFDKGFYFWLQEQ